MNCEITEGDHTFYVTLIPAIISDAAQLLRLHQNRLRVVPEVWVEATSKGNMVATLVFPKVQSGSMCIAEPKRG